jgi:hypothetical protein
MMLCLVVVVQGVVDNAFEWQMHDIISPSRLFNLLVLPFVFELGLVVLK